MLGFVVFVEEVCGNVCFGGVVLIGLCCYFKFIVSCFLLSWDILLYVECFVEIWGFFMVWECLVVMESESFYFFDGV